MPRYLLPLLLCVSLIVSAVGSAWAATAMAMPAPQATPDVGAAAPCHDQVSAAPDPQASPPCGDGEHCHCLQVASTLPPRLLPMQVAVPTPAMPRNTGGRAMPPPPPLIRPPIA